MGGTYTEAQKKASEKYQKTLANLSIKLKREEYDRIKAAADAEGVPLRQFVLAAINEKIDRQK
jgi:uncharacterized protein (DUF1778 family)